MQKSLLFAGVVSIVTAATAARAAENDLFSQFSAGSVFADAPRSDKPEPRPAAPVLELGGKVTETTHLARLLREAGLEPEEDAENRMVTTETAIDPWTVPVLVMISSDERHLIVGLLLATTDAPTGIPQDRLLQLLEANRTYAPTFFGYSFRHKRTELYHFLANERITGKRLGEEITRLAQIAKETENLWDFDSLAAKAAPAGRNEPNPTSEPAGDSPSLVGKWSAARSKSEAFAIQFQADGTFQLVYVNGVKQSRSTGSYRFSGPTLTLEGNDGFRLAGTFRSEGDSQFRFVPENASDSTGLIFRRAG